MKETELLKAFVDAAPKYGVLSHSDLYTARQEIGHVELDFSLASDTGLYVEDLKAIESVLGGTAEADEPEGGCDSCGHGARQIVMVRGGKLPC